MRLCRWGRWVRRMLLPVTFDHRATIKWIAKAAEQGNAEAKEVLEKLKSK